MVEENKKETKLLTESVNEISKMKPPKKVKIGSQKGEKKGLISEK